MNTTHTTPEMRDAFEKVFPLPFGCIRCGDGYASTSYGAWDAQAHRNRWEGWQAAQSQPAPPIHAQEERTPTIQRFNEAMANDEESPLERLRFFCALAMSGQDFLDVEPFFDALPAPAPPVHVSVQEIVRLMGPYVRASLDFATAYPDGELEGADAACTEAFKPLEAALTALVEENHRLKFELDGVRAMRGPLSADEVQAIVDLLKPDHDGSDFEPECPACTAYQKLTSHTHGIEPEQGEVK